LIGYLLARTVAEIRMMRLVVQWLVVLVVSWLPLEQASAQQSDFQLWSQVAVTTALDSAGKFSLLMDLQPRLGDDISRLERLVVRPALGYNLSEQIALSVGYGWVPGFINANYHHDFRSENRVWQQLLFKHSHFGIEWQHRLRQEQRFIQDVSGTSHRSRYSLKGSYLISKESGYGLTGFNEIFVTERRTDNGPRGGFDRDRFFFGPYLVAGPVRYEFGYLGEYAPRFGDDSRMIHAIFTSAHFTF
jgi:hypothetical protein